MTKRAYYTDAYTTDFHAMVKEVRAVDGGNALHNGLGYSALFTVLALGMFVGTVLLAGVPETRPVPSEPVPEPATSDRHRPQ